MRQWMTLMTVGLMLWSCSAVLASDSSDTQSQLQKLQERVAELELQAVSAQSRQSLDTSLTAGYDNRFFIKTTDDQFNLGIEGLLQFRHTYSQSDDGERVLDNEGQPAVDGDGVDPSASAAELERARLKFSGHVMKDVEYKIQLEMDDDNENSVNVLDYMVAYSVMPEFGVKLGRYKGAFSRQYNVGAGKLMMVDRSLADTVFNIGRSTGVELFGACPLGDAQMHYRLGAYNGLRDAGSAPFEDNDNNPAAAARFVVPLMGATPKDFDDESDLQGHANTVAQVGMSFAYANSRSENNFPNPNGTDDNFMVLARGDDGLSNGFIADGEVSMAEADIAVKSNGLSVILDGYYQQVNLDSPATAAGQFGPVRTGIDELLLQMNNFGWNLQSGIFVIPEKLELVSRVSGICLDSANNCYEYAGGWNYYLYGQDLKLSMDLTYIDDLPIVSSGPNYDGVQNNALFMVRTQLQFQF